MSALITQHVATGSIPTNVNVFPAILEDFAMKISMSVSQTRARTPLHVKMVSMISSAVVARAIMGQDVKNVIIRMIVTLVMVVVLEESYSILPGILRTEQIFSPSEI